MKSQKNEKLYYLFTFRARKKESVSLQSFEIREYHTYIQRFLSLLNTKNRKKIIDNCEHMTE